MLERDNKIRGFNPVEHVHTATGIDILLFLLLLFVHATSIPFSSSYCCVEDLFDSVERIHFSAFLLRILMLVYFPLFHSCDKHSVKFFKQFEKLVAEELVGSAEATALIEGRVFEVIGFDAEAGGNVVADEREPSHLLLRE